MNDCAAGATDAAPAPLTGAVGAAVAHDSARLHVAGTALYTDDLPEARGTLHAAIGTSARAHARLRALDLAPVRAAPGVVAVVAAADVPGRNDYGPVFPDDPIFAPGIVQYVGQSMFAVAARSVREARRAARLAVVDYEELPAILTLDEAMREGTFVLPSERLVRGDPAGAIARAPHRLAGALRTGGQDHFYLEGQVAYAMPGEDRTMRVVSSTQYPGEVQLKVAHALGVEAKDVAVECRRMGGGFGGKESQPALIACVAAVLARATARPVKLRLDRDDDMEITGKRHDFRIRYEVGFDERGRILGLELELASRCGCSVDLSGAINDRAMLHSDNAYYLENVGITSHRLRTHTVSNTAFRGFGGPQGMLGIEQVIDHIACHLGMDPLEVRRANFYGRGERDVTHYHQRLTDNVVPELVEELAREADYHGRRAAIRALNAQSPVVRRGIALTPVKFGISFTATHLNQAGALVNLYTDGTVLVNHGGTEMGQGLYTKVAQVVAQELGVDLDRVRVSAADTSKVPNASATAASAGADLNGKAAQAAARELRQRLVALAASRLGVSEREIEPRRNGLRAGGRYIAFDELARLAHQARVPLSATGFYATPDIGYDRKAWRGRPFYYFCYGAAVSEVAIDTLTGECRLLRADVLHEVGRSLNPAIDRGQIEGGFVQGVGWLTSEELWWNAEGRLVTHSPSTYKIPAASDLPPVFNVRIRESAGNVEDAIFRSKAVGEPPLMLAISVLHAIRDAVASLAGYAVAPALDPPATPEAILRAVDDLRRRSGEAGAVPEAAGAKDGA